MKYLTQSVEKDNLSLESGIDMLGRGIGKIIFIYDT